MNLTGKPGRTTEIIPMPEIEADNPYSHDLDIPDGEKLKATAKNLRNVSEDFARIMRQECLILLLTTDRDWFLKHYSGETTDMGYLLTADGRVSGETAWHATRGECDKAAKIALEKFALKRQEIDQILQGQ